MSLDSLENTVRSRVRMFLRHTWIATILGSIILGGTIWGAVYYTTKATQMRIAVGSPDGANAKFARLLAQRFAQHHDRVRLQLVTTDGPKASAQAFATGSTDLAILPSTIGNSPNWPVVAIVRKNVMALIVPASGASTAVKKPTGAKSTDNSKDKDTRSSKNKDSKSSKDKDSKSSKNKDTKGDKAAKTGDTDTLEKVRQLAGRRLGIVTGNEATTDLLEIVLNHYGVPLSRVKVSLIDPKNLADAVRAHRVDALFVAGDATGQAITDAVKAASRNGRAPTFIEIDQADGIAARNPAFTSVDIEAGTFGGNPPAPDDTLKSLSFPEYLVARRSFDHDAIATLAKQIYSSRLALAAAMPGEVKIEAPSTDKDAEVNVHPGALAYLTDDQKSFFDKYGDDIFYGLLIFPIFGSAIAGLATYLRNDTRARRLRLLQRVLDLVRKAHAAQTLEAIEQLQIEADQLVISIIHQSEHEEFEDTVRMSFSFALDQLRFTIAARRTAILDRLAAGGKAVAA
jgi:TRAP-type uncharacterized transport system substrate-binding protein